MQMENSLLGMTELLMLSGSQTPDFGVASVMLCWATGTDLA